MGLLLKYNLRNLRARWKTTLLAIFGIAMVVAAVVVIASMSAGFRIALSSTGSDSNAMIVQRGSLSELTSWINIGNVQTILSDPRIARDPQGTPLVSCEIIVIAAKPKKTDNQPANITLRGVTPMAFNVRNNIKVVEGRMFTPGLFEVIVGKKISDRVMGLNIGDTLRVQRKEFKVVGLFTADGSSFESEVWGDYNALGPAVNRNGGCDSLTARMVNPASIPAFDKDLRANPQMQVQAESERKYYEDQSGNLGMVLKILAAFVGIVMGIGAVFGAMNTMYAIVSQRTREIGTLRALGFSRFNILFSFVTESVFLAFVGGVLGCILALPMQGFTAGTGNTQSFSELAFAFQITPPIVLTGMIFAVLMGFLGGLLPAFRAARMPITIALREA
jgi:putative ABC transport system permease protein